MKKTSKFLAIVAGIVALSGFVLESSFAECPSFTGPSYIFATKAPPGQEEGHTPTYVAHSGGYVFTKNLTGDLCHQISYEFKAVHYAQDYTVASIRIEVFGEDGKKIGSTTESVDAQIQDWRDIHNLKKYTIFHGTIETDSKIAKVKIFAVPGNWAVILRDIQFMDLPATP